MAGVYHAIFSRQGGVSPEPWKSLNLGGSVGDDPDRVRNNRENALACQDVNPVSVYDVYQVHSTEVVCTDKPLPKNEAHVKADAIITNQQKLTLLMRFADCVPIFLFDPILHVIGIAHAGWIGTVNKIASNTVAKMHLQYGCEPKNMIAAIGPSIGPDHYSVGSDVIEKVKANFPGSIDRLISYRNGKAYFDLWMANQVVLTEAGVKQIEVAGLCTQCNPDDWYSHRGEHGKTGRFGAIIGLN